MSRRQVFRAHAEQCLRLAETVKSSELRSILIIMAHGWHRLAREYAVQGERPVSHLTKATAERAERDLKTA
jgi:hypothetical protein